MTSNFTHLHVHTQYSLLDGAIRLKSLFEKTHEFGLDSVAITDHGTMFGAVEFYEKALAENIKPIIGCECYLAPRSLKDKTPLDSKGTCHLVLLAKNNEGYKNLCRLASVAQLDGFYYKPRIDKELLQAHSGGLIALSACLHGEIPRLFTAGKLKEADEAARYYQRLFGEDGFYLEIQHNGMEIQEKVNQALADMSQRLSIPLVATNDCHYLNREDAKAHEVLLCIQTQTTIHDPNRFKFSTDELYFKSPQDMYTAFSNYPEALQNTVEIAKRCEVDFDLKTYHFPQYDATSDLTVDDIFRNEVEAGYQKRLDLIKKKTPDIDENVYRDRLEYEVGIIIKMGFPGYFLIVADFIRYAKENHIPVGPGRGSAAGSIVAYSMGITDLDPIEHGLIFERFLNPARISMPDIDVDFCINGREKVFKYVVDRYGGGDYVAQIITFGKLKSRAVIRDVGRALNIPLREVDALAKMVPEMTKSLDDALKQEPKITELTQEKPEIAELIKICRTLEGLPRHASTHAAGVVISDKPLVEYLPLYKGKNDEVVTQFDMTHVEHIGLVKFDFLGLRNLTVIDNALNLIAQQGKTAPDLLELDFDDPATYRLLSSGDTTGVFQLESSGMKNLLVRLKPACFSDITALVALYRPGPLDSGMVDTYVERKHGREKVEYLFDELEPLLNETYGVILYQEQVMKIAGVLANYSMAEADGLRKAMGKKIAKIMAEHRDLFMKGTAANNHPADKAKELFDLMEKFGGYGFNKSHSAAYALIAFQTAYLKAHFPVEFMAALLTSEMHSSDGVVKYINECNSHAIAVLPPDVNESQIEFAVVDGKIRFGLVAIKNVGEGPIEAILDARKDGKFTSLFDFCERVNLRKINKRVLESLIKSGAFDSTGSNRASMMASLDDAIEYGQRVQREKADPQMSLFDMEDAKNVNLNRPPLIEMEEWDDKLLLSNEKEMIGFYITGHPLEKYGGLLEKFTDANALSIRDVPNGKTSRIGGIVRGVKPLRTKKGDMMAFATIEDMHGSVEIVIFPGVFAESGDLLFDDNIILIQGEVQQEENGAKMLAEKIVPIDKAEETWTAAIRINLNMQLIETETLKQLKSIMTKHPGSCRVFFHMQLPDVSETVIALPDAMKLKAGIELSREISGLLGYDAVQSTCAAITAAPKKTFRNGWRGN